MDVLAQFLAMGGYSAYIWPAYGVVLIVMGIMWITSMRGWRKSEQALASLRNSRRQRRNSREAFEE